MSRCSRMFFIMDPNGETHLVPCGKCYDCRSNIRNSWIARCKAEYISSNGGLFITLTYDNSNLSFEEVKNDDGIVIKVPVAPVRDMQLFMKRLRKKFGNVFRYLAVSEYGSRTLRPHWHMLLFFKENITKDGPLYDAITTCWNLGYLTFGDIEDASITYVTKYILKDDDLPSYLHTNALMSRRPAIGFEYISKFMDIFNKPNENLSLLSIHGSNYPLPRLFRDKLVEKFDEFKQKELKQRLKDNFDQSRRDDSDRYYHFNPNGVYGYYLREVSQTKSALVKKHFSKHDLI